MIARSKKQTSHLYPLGSRVNLMPAAERERREGRRLIRRWALVLGVVVALVAMVTIAAQGLRIAAEIKLAAEHQRTVELTAELAGFSELTQTIAERTRLQTFRGEALSNDLAWRDLIDDVEKAAPLGVRLAGVELLSGAVPHEEPETAIGVAGTLIFTTKDGADQARTVVALRKLKGALAIDAGNLKANDDGFEFVVTFALDQTRYTGRFATESGR